MEYNTYSELASRTMADLGYRQKDNLHMVLGMVDELGEIAKIFKAELAYNKKIDYVNLEEEVGDLMWFVSNLCRTNNLDMGKVLDKNIAKLKVRYPDKYSDDKANNRDLKKERETLES